MSSRTLKTHPTLKTPRDDSGVDFGTKWPVPQDVGELLAANGYRQFSSASRGTKKHCDAMFQRGVRDVTGKRYAITLWGYAPKEDGFVGWRWAAELNVNEPHLTFEQHGLKLEDGDGIALLENRCDAFWQAMGCPYYKRFDDDA